MQSRKSQGVTVIGAGIGGMAISALLSKQGYKVRVFEQSSTYGGKSRKVNVGQSTFGLGPSLCTDVETIDRVFRTCGKKPRDYWNFTKLTELARYFWAEDANPYVMPTGLPYIERSLVREFSEKPRKIRKYMEKLEYAYEKVAPLYTDKPFDFSHHLKPSIKKIFKTVPLALQTLDTRNGHYFSSPRARQIFNRYATYSGSNPYLAPALTGLAGAPEILHGAYYVEGGISGICDGLYRLCNDLGVDFAFNSRVTSIEDDGKGKVTAIRTKSKKIPVESIIFNGDIVRMHELLGDSQNKHRELTKERSMSGLMFYWQVKGNFKKLGLHNIFFSADYAKEFEQIYRQDEIPEDPTIYLTISIKLDKNHAPKGAENWRVMINTPASLPESSVLLARELILDKLEALMGGYIEIQAEESVCSHNLDSITGSWGGAIYGQSSNSISLLARRPSNKTAGYDNLYVVGGTVHPGGGIPLVLRSAFITSRYF